MSVGKSSCGMPSGPTCCPVVGVVCTVRTVGCPAAAGTPAAAAAGTPGPVVGGTTGRGSSFAPGALPSTIGAAGTMPPTDGPGAGVIVSGCCGGPAGTDGSPGAGACGPG